MLSRRYLLALLAVGTFSTTHKCEEVLAEDAKPMSTSISIEGMHCESCAEQVAKKLSAVSAVASVKIDVKAGKAVIVAAKDKVVSPKALWEAVLATGYTPKKIDGPSGAFTKKPKS